MKKEEEDHRFRKKKRGSDGERGVEEEKDIEGT